MLTTQIMGASFSILCLRDRNLHTLDTFFCALASSILLFGNIHGDYLVPGHVAFHCFATKVESS